MKYVKVFEAYGRSEDMETEFSQRNGNKYNVDLEDFPKEIDRTNPAIQKSDADELQQLGFSDKVEITDNMVSEVRITYTIDVYKDRGGISDAEFIMKSVRILGEYAIWNEEKEEDDYIEYEIEDIGPFDGRVEFSTGILPWYPENLVIEMDRSFDPKRFKYRVELGQ